MPEPIAQFQGEYRWLSNFWPATVMLDGICYPSVEHAYVAAKSLDPDFRWKVSDCAKPGDAKRLGRRAVLRPDWDDVKLTVMENLLAQKFTNPGLKNKLIATGTADLVEGNKWGDTFWGVCNGKGDNHLGRLLMALRERLQTEEEPEQ